MSRHRINVVTVLLMIMGACVFVSIAVSTKAHSAETSWSEGAHRSTNLSNFELFLYAALGAAPGWILNGVLKRFLLGEKSMPLPRCKECGGILAQQGDICRSCRA